ARVREGLQEAEEPKRVTEADERGEEAAEKGAEQRRREADGGERESAVERAVAHLAEERTDECLRELIRELVEDDEGQDLERAVTGKEAEERLPHGAPETRRGRHGLLRFRRAPGDEQREELEE